MTFFSDRMSTPVGEMLLICDDDARLHLYGWYERMQVPSRFVDLIPRRNPFGLVKAMEAYFRGEVHVIDDLPVTFSGTPFQVKVWNALRTIPAGETTSYGALAKKIGEAKAVRAVGLANGSNPIAVIVPCHRVIGSDGSLTGYGGGLDRKKWLLAHEARHAAHGLFAKERFR